MYTMFAAGDGAEAVSYTHLHTVVELVVFPLLCQQFLMGAALNDMPVFQLSLIHI